MSRSINESVQLLSQTLDNCKTNLAEKQVADVDNIKISDVDEKIAEIKSGGGGGIDVDNPKYISFTPNQTFHTYDTMEMTEFTNTINVNFNFDDYSGSKYDLTYRFLANYLSFDNNPPGLHGSVMNYDQIKEIEVKFTGTSSKPMFLILLVDQYNNIIDMAKVNVLG